MIAGVPIMLAFRSSTSSAVVLSCRCVAPRKRPRAPWGVGTKTKWERRGSAAWRWSASPVRYLRSSRAKTPATRKTTIAMTPMTAQSGIQRPPVPAVGRTRPGYTA